MSDEPKSEIRLRISNGTYSRLDIWAVLDMMYRYDPEAVRMWAVEKSIKPIFKEATP